MIALRKSTVNFYDKQHKTERRDILFDTSYWWVDFVNGCGYIPYNNNSNKNEKSETLGSV